MEMCDGKISVCLKAPTRPDDCFGIALELDLSEADRNEPSMGRGYEAVLGQMVKIREGGAERCVAAAEAFLLQLT
jgi:hypothetical protein